MANELSTMEVPLHDDFKPKKPEKKIGDFKMVDSTNAPKEALLFDDKDVDKMFGMVIERDEKGVEQNNKETERAKIQSLLMKDLPALENYLQVNESINQLSAREDVQKMLKVNREMEGLAKTLRTVSMPTNKDEISPENLKSLKESLSLKTEESKRYKEAEAQYNEVKKAKEKLEPEWVLAKERMSYFYDRLPDRDQRALVALTLICGDEDFAEKYSEKLPDADKKILEVAPDMKAELVKRRIGSELQTERLKMKMQSEDPIEILQAIENVAISKQQYEEARKLGDEKKMKEYERKIFLNQQSLESTGITFNERINKANFIREAIVELENGKIEAARSILAMVANTIPEENIANRAKVNAAKNNVINVAAGIKWQKYAKSQQTK